jgi:predicted methyltransferase
MVQYSNIATITAAFQPMIGGYCYADVAHRPDTETALALAHLQPGHTVLELGPGSGHLIAQAKVAVGASFCAAVEAVQGFIDVDIPRALAERKIAGQVQLLRANITDGALVNRIRALHGAPQTFDYIFALHIFSTIPPTQRRQTLRNLRNLPASPTSLHSKPNPLSLFNSAALAILRLLAPPF